MKTHSFVSISIVLISIVNAVPTGIEAGIRGIYFCTSTHFKAPCFWKEILPEYQDGKTCIHIHSEDGFNSFGPDPGLSVQIWDTKNCDGEMPWYKNIMCPGNPNLPMGALGGDVKDIWVKVKVPERKTLAYLPPNCDFDDSDIFLSKSVGDD